jgi:hypothetical protein
MSNDKPINAGAINDDVDNTAEPSQPAAPGPKKVAPLYRRSVKNRPRMTAPANMTRGAGGKT